MCTCIFESGTWFPCEGCKRLHEEYKYMLFVTTVIRDEKAIPEIDKSKILCKCTPCEMQKESDHDDQTVQ